LTIRLPTNSIARIAVRGGQCKAAVNKRFANAAERQDGELDPDVRREKAEWRALNNITDGWECCVFWDGSTSAEILRDGIIIYR
jgi:hypothetical protein